MNKFLILFSIFISAIILTNSSTALAGSSEAYANARYQGGWWANDNSAIWQANRFSPLSPEGTEICVEEENLLLLNWYSSISLAQDDGFEEVQTLENLKAILERFEVDLYIDDVKQDTTRGAVKSDSGPFAGVEDHYMSFSTYKIYEPGELPVGSHEVSGDIFLDGDLQLSVSTTIDVIACTE